MSAYRSPYGTPIVAVVYNADGTVYDRCFTWEAGQNYAMHEGRRVVATADDGGMTVDGAQRLYDADLAAHVDCWGAPLYLAERGDLPMTTMTTTASCLACGRPMAEYGEGPCPANLGGDHRTYVTTTPSPTPTLSPAAKRWRKRIGAGVFEHGQVRSFAYLPARMAEGLTPCGTGARDTTLTAEEAVDLCALLAANPVRIPDELTETGRRWLERWSAERLPGFPTDRLRDFSHYTYAGEHAPTGPYHSVPVWRVHFTDGGPFLTYAVTSARTAALSGDHGNYPGNWTEGAW